MIKLFKYKLNKLFHSIGYVFGSIYEETKHSFGFSSNWEDGVVIMTGLV